MATLPEPVMWASLLALGVTARWALLAVLKTLRRRKDERRDRSHRRHPDTAGDSEEIDTEWARTAEAWRRDYL
ncbi:hypothetical protein GCM10009678_15090 [Actinomadura kijaniata]|uniref:Uncharacterized protein n=1 Tax=Actinomadura namibiensis TaxID=182080 RepID=A0A7W3LQZ5_ACTNM|nr:hypothetical protein [Actinomadura namibiensis]MBA8952674.1 hypothetical protein [Actinomadura namibiensis]